MLWHYSFEQPVIPCSCGLRFISEKVLQSLTTGTARGLTRTPLDVAVLHSALGWLLILYGRLVRGYHQKEV